jgi:hypothetical protein
MAKGKAAADSLLLMPRSPATCSKKRFSRSGVRTALGLPPSAEPVLIFQSLQVDDPLQQSLYGLGALSMGKLQQIYNQPSRDIVSGGTYKQYPLKFYSLLDVYIDHP